jgi:YHS domain-containing protein
MKYQIKSSVAVISICLLAITGACSRPHAVKKDGSATSERGIEPVYKFSGALALKGYDAVSYFNTGSAVVGSEQYAHEWNGANWHFASAVNRDLFASEPHKYAPQYGGYCAWAVGHGYTAKGDPEAWKIVDGKLYLNYNKSVQEKWMQDIPNYVAKGDENWQQFLKEKPEHKGE